MIDISNLTKYGFSREWKPFPMSNPPKFGELSDGEYVKFEDVVELLKQADNIESAPFIKCDDVDCSKKAVHHFCTKHYNEIEF
jgi:hypothetical protein